MRKLATVFILAVLVPTLVLAWLAMRSMRDQEIVANSQRALLYQSSTEALAADLNSFMDDVRVFFRQHVDKLVLENGGETLVREFDTIGPDTWLQCSVAAVSSEFGEIFCPAPTSADPEAQSFLKFNGTFLRNQSNERFYEASSVRPPGPVITLNRVKKPSLSLSSKSLEGLLEASPAFRRDVQVDSLSLDNSEPEVVLKELPLNLSNDLSGGDIAASKSKVRRNRVQLKVEVAQNKFSNNPFRRINIQTETLRANAADQKRAKHTEQAGSSSQQDAALFRNVNPTQSLYGAATQLGVDNNLSQLTLGTGNLRDIIADKSEGALSRFLQDGLHVLLWRKHANVPDRIFWVELDLEEICKDLSKYVSGHASTPDICLALLNEEGALVASTHKAFTSDWSKPFVASEVGQILPHWEVAAYLLDPDSISPAVRTARLTVWLLVPSLLLAIILGTLLIFRSVGSEMRMARQKTDFVSNVSHELRTPLTSIRMFSEMLTETATSNKDKEYSGIISREAARLTRLINNLLDFSRLEHADQPYDTESLNLGELTQETVETYRMHLEADGCRLIYQPEPSTARLSVKGDRDALSQVLLNLLSNAEKYGCTKGDIIVRLAVDRGRSTATWQVLDRGSGIDRRHANKIFDKFYRVDDSLSSGIQGSGLGLALARQIVEHHQGQISYQRREGGGSCFTVALPIEF